MPGKMVSAAHLIVDKGSDALKPEALQGYFEGQRAVGSQLVREGIERCKVGPEVLPNV